MLKIIYKKEQMRILSTWDLFGKRHFEEGLEGRPEEPTTPVSGAHGHIAMDLHLRYDAPGAELSDGCTILLGNGEALAAVALLPRQRLAQGAQICPQLHRPVVRGLEVPVDGLQRLR